MNKYPMVIAGTGTYLPEEKITNRDFSPVLGLDDEGILKRTGILERRRAHPGEATSDLATKAAQEALKAAGIQPREVDYIVLSTTSPDMAFPATACMVQRNLQAFRAPAFDISAGCAGFLVALQVAEQFLQSPSTRNILVIAAETKTRYVNFSDPKTAILFGDGAGAAVVRKTRKKEGVLSLRLKSDGTFQDLIKIPAGGSRRPASPGTLERNEHTITMRGESLYRVAVQKTAELVSELLEDAQMTACNLSYVILHQANLRLIKTLSRRLGIREEQLVVTLDRIGNTSSSSIPITLDTLVKKNLLKGGETILLAGFGAGLTWGAALIQWPES